MQKQVIQHLSSQDEVLHSIIKEVDWPEVNSTHNVFHDLLSCVIEQQIHYRSTKKTFAKLLAKASLRDLTPDNFTRFEEVMDDVKLSMNKYETIAGILEFFDLHSPDWLKMSNAEIKEALFTIKGVGHWTTDMILLYTLERPNVFPAQDYHLKQLMSQLYQIDSRQVIAEMKRIAQYWAPYQSYGVKYLLAWKATNKRKKP